MSKSTAVGSAISVLLFSFVPCEAETTTDVLLKACNAGGEAEKMCNMYIMGATQGLHYASKYIAFQAGGTETSENVVLSQQLLNACIPPSVNGEQTYAIVLKYMQSHPEIWHEPAVPVIHRAMMEAFPCG